MDKFEIENAINEIMAECEFFTDDNPITYMIFLDRYKHILNDLQIKNTHEIIDNIKARNDFKVSTFLKKFDNPLCQVPLEERPKFEVDVNEFKE